LDAAVFNLEAFTGLTTKPTKAKAKTAGLVSGLNMKAHGQNA